MARERFYSLSCGVEYLSVPKCACTSIKTALAESDGVLLKRVHGARHWRRCPGDFVPCLVFSFVRHPLTRLVSGWRNKLQTGLARTIAGCPLPVDASFREFARWVTGQAPARANRHWMPQTLILAGQRVDFLGRFERIAEDWQRLRDEFGLPELAQMNQSPGAREEVPLDRATRERIARFYADDLRAYGYTL